MPSENTEILEFNYKNLVKPHLLYIKSRMVSRNGWWM